MAKGLRASSKVKARNARRYTTGPNDDNKEKARQGDEAVKVKGEAPATMETDDATATVAQVKATTSGPNDSLPSEGKKISTSGTRESRRETWRKARGWKPKTGSKNGGKPKRRR